MGKSSKVCTQHTNQWTLTKPTCVVMIRNVCSPGHHLRRELQAGGAFGPNGPMQCDLDAFQTRCECIPQYFLSGLVLE
jgi:hypothetical protein